MEAWLLPRVPELAYTAWDLAPFAPECGHDGLPFRGRLAPVYESAATDPPGRATRRR